MTIFKVPFFASSNIEVENFYTNGVLAIQEGSYAAADKFLQIAAKQGYVSALYNLSLLHGAGYVTPYAIDFAVDCYYKAAAAGHKGAISDVHILKAADRGGLEIDDLARLAASWLSLEGLNCMTMMVSCRLFQTLCQKYDAVADVLAYEIDAASCSDDRATKVFIQRTGLSSDLFEGGLDKIEPGSAADLITDGLNNLYVAMKTAGHNDALCRMARCTIVGYILAKSVYGSHAQPLLSVESFLAEGTNEFVIGNVRLQDAPKDHNDIFELSKKLLDEFITKIHSEQDIYYFVIEQYERILTYNELAQSWIQDVPFFLRKVEYEGKRSESSNVGRNPGIIYLEEVVAPAINLRYGQENTEVMATGIFSLLCQNNVKIINSIRMKYALHNRDWYISTGNLQFADKWSEVIFDLEVASISDTPS